MIRLYRGDHSDFADLNQIVITIDTDLSLDGFTGCFCFLGVTREFSSDQIAAKTVTIAYTAEETAEFVPGQSYGKFTLFDAQGRKAAVQKVLVEVLTHRMCAGAPYGQIAIAIENQFDYNTARNKPSINGVTVLGDKTGAEYGLNRIPAYSPDATYAVDDQCLYGHALYVCIRPIASPEPWTPEHWQLLVGETDPNAVHYTADEGKSKAEQTQARQNIGAASAADLADHTSKRDNPHEVTKEQVGLGNVDNTADVDKPVSRAVEQELSRLVPIARLKAAVTDPASVKLAPASLKAYLTEIYNAVQAL